MTELSPLDKQQYLEALNDLLKEAQKEHNLFIKHHGDEQDKEYVTYLYEGVLHWGLRVSQLKEKIVDARFHTRQK